MQLLNESYAKQDLLKVKEILHSLENSTNFEVSSDTMEDKELLKAKIQEYKQNIEDIETEIDEIKEDETYQTISSLDDWGQYFEELRSELLDEKRKLEEEAKEVLKQNKIDSNDKNDTHWTQTSTMWHEDDSLFKDEDPWTIKEEKKKKPKPTKKKEKEKKIQREQTPYTSHIHNIENLTFEKIRRYCNNLLNDNKADTMQEYLAKNGKMYKAIIYNALEQFIENIDNETITLIDWGSDQGIASMLILDYIKEKQLDINVNQIILIDTDDKILSRAMGQVEVLDFNSASIDAVNISNSQKNIVDILQTIENDTTLNLFANDKMPVDYLDIDYTLFKTGYFLCVSNENKEFVTDVSENLKDFMDLENLSIKDGKIGRFTKYERISKTKYSHNNYEQNIPTIDIDNDEIPF